MSGFVNDATRGGRPLRIRRRAGLWTWSCRLCRMSTTTLAPWGQTLGLALQHCRARACD